MRKAAAVLKPNLVISAKDDTFTLRTESTFKTSETSFKLGEEYQETTPDGRKVMVRITQEPRLDSYCL